MITLISRKRIFDKYHKIAEEISTMQRQFYDDDPVCFASEYDRIEYKTSFDAKDIHIETTKKLYSVLSFPHEDIETFPSALSQKLTTLFAELAVEQLVMISHFKMNFVGNLNNTYPPLQVAFKKFEKITGHVDYDEAFTFDTKDLADLIEIAFWIGRCDAAGPEFIFFFDQDEKLAFYLCKDGNVHAIEFENEILSDMILSRTGWEFVHGSCVDKFSNTSKIEGRKSKR